MNYNFIYLLLETIKVFKIEIYLNIMQYNIHQINNQLNLNQNIMVLFK